MLLPTPDGPVTSVIPLISSHICSPVSSSRWPLPTDIEVGHMYFQSGALVKPKCPRKRSGVASCGA